MSKLLENNAEFHRWYKLLQSTVETSVNEKIASDGLSIEKIKAQQLLGNKIIDMPVPNNFKEFIKELLDDLTHAIQGGMAYYSPEKARNICYYGFEIECWYDQLIIKLQ